MTENIEKAADTATGSAAKKDCGCGCGGSGGCGEKTPENTAARRRFLAGGVTLTAFAATLPSRRAFADTNCTLSGAGLLSHNGSNSGQGSCSVGGMSPGFWKQNAQCWPVPLNSTFASVGFSIPMGISLSSSDYLACAIQNTNTIDFHLVAAILNILTPSINALLQYKTLTELSNGIAAALTAGKTQSEIGDALDVIINNDGNSLGKSFCSGNKAQAVNCPP